MPKMRAAALLLLATSACAGAGTPPTARPFPASPGEPRLANLRQLTDGGENAEAYFSADGERLVFQATRPGVAECDQIFTMRTDGSDLRRVSRGGRTTCAYFFPRGGRLLYSSTHLSSPACPPRPDYSRGYVWALYEYDVVTAGLDGGGLRSLTSQPGYDAEATVSPDGPLLRDGLVRPTTLEIWVMDADGGNKRQVTSNGAANFAPFFHPDGRRIIFSSNLHDPRGRDFDLYLVNVDGTGLERVTTSGEFDGFPMFSPDGRRLVFASNRGARSRGDTNVFIADWVER